MPIKVASMSIVSDISICVVLLSISACSSVPPEQNRDSRSEETHQQVKLVNISEVDREWRKRFYKSRGYYPPFGYVYMNRNEPERIKWFNATPPEQDEYRDSSTGYIWRRCEEGQQWNGSGCIGKSICFAHHAAQDYSFSRAWQENKPWRVPGVRELINLYSGIFQDKNEFPTSSSAWLWSSERLGGGQAGYLGYIVRFYDGNHKEPQYDKESLGRCHSIRLMRRS